MRQSSACATSLRVVLLLVSHTATAAATAAVATSSHCQPCVTKIYSLAVATAVLVTCAV